MRTAQQLFDTVASHLRQQNAKSADGLSCLYRGPHGLKCAIGILIEDNIYSPIMEGWNVRQLIAHNGRGYQLPDELLSELKTHMDLLSELQKVHDHHHIGLWESTLQELAQKYHLNYTPPIKLEISK